LKCRVDGFTENVESDNLAAFARKTQTDGSDAAANVQLKSNRTNN
jgi:hypothetical protein